MKFEIKFECMEWNEVQVNLILWKDNSILKYMTVAFWGNGDCHLMTEKKSVMLSKENAVKALNGFMEKYNK